MKDHLHWFIIDLENFIYRYVPRGWKEHIGRVIFIPRFTEEEMKTILNGDNLARAKYPVIQEAIVEWQKIKGIKK